MAGKSNDQIAFGEVSDHDYLKALIVAGVLPPTVVPGFVSADIEGTGSNEPGFDTAGRALKSGDPRRDEDASEAEVEARADIRGGEDKPESSVDSRTLPTADLETPVSVGVEDGGPPADADAGEDSTETEDAADAEEPARDPETGRFVASDEE